MSSVLVGSYMGELMGVVPSVICVTMTSGDEITQLSQPVTRVRATGHGERGGLLAGCTPDLDRESLYVNSETGEGDVSRARLGDESSASNTRRAACARWVLTGEDGGLSAHSFWLRWVGVESPRVESSRVEGTRGNVTLHGDHAGWRCQRGPLADHP